MSRVSKAAASAAWAALLTLSAAAAAYAGLRLPNLWSVTLYNVEVTDGTIRRAFVGTVLGPVWRLGHYQYWVYAAAAYLVLLALLVAIIRAAVRARGTSQRILAALWLLAPTGAYLFHEVGYLDQVVYLLLFLSLWLWRRTPAAVAVLPVTLSVFAHEIALLAAWPVLAWFVLDGRASRAERLALLLPAAAGAVVLAWPPLAGAQVAHLALRLRTSLPFPIREDAIALLGRGAAGSLASHALLVGLVKVAPFAVVLGIAWLGLYWWRRRGGAATALSAGGAFAASVAPLLLFLGGWDTDRWVFLALSNFALVLFLWLERHGPELSVPELAAAALPFVLLFYSPLQFLDGYAPRTITPAGLHQFMTDPDMFRFPADKPPRGWRLN